MYCKHLLARKENCYMAFIGLPTFFNQNQYSDTSANEWPC